MWNISNRRRQCVRKLYILTKDGFNDREMEFFPCKQYNDFDEKYQRAFRYCKSQVHKLEYNLKYKYASLCSEVMRILKRIIVGNGIDLISIQRRIYRKKIISGTLHPIIQY